MGSPKCFQLPEVSYTAGVPRKELERKKFKLLL